MKQSSGDRNRGRGGAGGNAATTRPTADAFGTGTVALVFLGLAILYFLPAFLPFRHIYGSDYWAAGYFFHEFISERLAQGDLPKWVPYVYGGLPLFANPGSTYYPFRWLADLLFPVSRIYPTIFVIQFALAGLGMYLLTVELGVRRWIAFVAGAAFQFTGLTMSFVLAGHDGRIIVATLAPLLFFFLHRGVRTGSFGAFVGAAATVGFALLSFQIQSCYYLLLGGLAWAVFCLFDHGVHRRGRQLGVRVALGLGAVAFGFVLASVNFLPFLDYVELSPRGETGGRGYEYSTSWSMPPDEIIGLAVPEQHGGSVFGYYRVGEAPSEMPNPFKLHTEYVGAFTILMLILGIAYARRDRRWWFFGGLTALALLISFGGHTPVYRLFYELLPGTKRFRAPSISFFLVSMSLVAMAALALEALARRRDAVPDQRAATGPAMPRLVWWIGGTIGLFLLGLLGSTSGGDAGAAGDLITRGWLRFLVFLSLTGAIVWAWARAKLPATAAAVLLAGTTVADLWVIDRKFFETREPPSEAFAPDRVVDTLQGLEGPFRVWVLPLQAPAGYAQLPDYLMHYDVEMAGGEHGNQLQRYNQFIGAGEQTYVDWSNFLELGKFMDAANVRYLIAGVPLGGVPWRTILAERGATIFENTDALPRAWLVGRTAVVPEDRAIEFMRQPSFDFRSTAVLPAPLEQPLPDAPLAGAAQVTLHSPDRVVVRTSANRDALLVLADNYYEDWRVTVDGAPARLHRANHTFRGVRVGAGEHEVIFTFEPTKLYVGFAIHLVGMVLLIGYGGWAAWRWWRRRPAPAPAA